MRKLYVLVGTLLVCACGGCSEDPNDRLIAGTINTLKESTSLIEQITKSLNDAAAQAENDKKPLALDKIETAITGADDLKKKAKILQNIKAEAERRKDNITPDQHEEYAKKYKSDFQQALKELYAAENNLGVALKRADAIAIALSDEAGKRALDEKNDRGLRKKLKDAQDDFEVLTKRQS